MRTTTSFALVLALAGALGLSPVHLAAQTVYDVIAGSPDHTTLETAIDAAGLAGALQDASAEYTVFAPDDDAFAQIPPAELQALLADQAALQSVLLYHVLDFAAPSSIIPQGLVFTEGLAENDSDARLTVQIVRDGAAITLNDDAAVNAADLAATNGVVHSLDAVIFAQTLGGLVANSPEHTTLEAALGVAEIELLDDEGLGFDLTVFAPTDAAFDSLPAGTVDTLLANPDDLADVLGYHLTGGYQDATSLQGLRLQRMGFDGLIAETLGDAANSTLLINRNPVEIADLNATNGVLHVIGDVLLPPTTADYLGFSFVYTTLNQLAGATGIDDVLDDPDSDLTLFAPTDGAFRNDSVAVNALGGDLDAISEVLVYHTVPGSFPTDSIAAGLSFENSTAGFSLQFENDGANPVEVNNRTVDLANYATTNGLIHVIQLGILTPPNVVDVAARSPVHGTLVDAVVAADLVGALADTAATLTVFAPTDAAFAAVPDSTLAALLDDPAGALTRVLTYHVLGQEVSASDIIDNNVTSATTLNGEDVDIAVSNGVVTLNGDIDVVIADIIATNGIVHVIDGVLVPANVFTSTSTPAAEAGIRVAPIPADAFTDVTLPAGFSERGGVTLALLDARGAQLSERRIGAGTTRLDLADYPAGAYYLVLRDGERQYHQTVIVR